MQVAISLAPNNPDSTVNTIIGAILNTSQSIPSQSLKDVSSKPHKAIYRIVQRQTVDHTTFITYTQRLLVFVCGSKKQVSSFHISLAINLNTLKLLAISDMKIVATITKLKNISVL